ncbi:MAG TPA: nucleotidyltransferase family protein [Chloroflexota bacterium]|nr:nucleotidyltransferase family protein [Chloroflexota bacterium]
MTYHDDVLLAAAASLRSTLHREPEPDEVVRLLVENQVPLLTLVERRSLPATASVSMIAAASHAVPAIATGVSTSAESPRADPDTAVQAFRPSRLRNRKPLGNPEPLDSLDGSSNGMLDDATASNGHAIPSADADLMTRTLTSDAFADAVAADRRTYDEVHGNFVRAVDAWNSRGVECIAFKSAGIAPSYPYTSENFDILFRAGDERGAREGLNALGYVLLANCDEPQKWLYRLFVAGRSVSAIHLHTRVGWGQGFMLEDGIWARRRPSADDPVTWVPGPEDVILINAAHAFFENKAFGLHDIMKIRQAIADGVDWDVADRVARERGWLSAFHFALAMMARLEERLFEQPRIPRARFERSVAGNDRMREQLRRAETLPPAMPFPTSWKLVKVLFFDKIRRDRHEPPTAKPGLVFLTLARGVKSQADARPQNSGLFTLSGIDGSGKTRQAEGLLDAFEVCHLRTRVMWARLGATPLMHRVSRVWRKDGSGERTIGGSSPAVEDEVQSSRFKVQSSRANPRGFPRAMWALASSVDFALWLLRIRWRLVRGDIVVADRYMCDFDVELSVKLASQTRLRRVILAALKTIAPRPRRAFLLDVGPDEARARALPDGGDFDPETGIHLYRDRGPKYGLVPIDTRADFETASAVVEREGLRAYFNRYGMLGNNFFFQNPWQLNRPVRKQFPQEVGPVEPVAVS